MASALLSQHLKSEIIIIIIIIIIVVVLSKDSQLCFLVSALLFFVV